MSLEGLHPASLLAAQRDGAFGKMLLREIRWAAFLSSLVRDPQRTNLQALSAVGTLL